MLAVYSHDWKPAPIAADQITNGEAFAEMVTGPSTREISTGYWRVSAGAFTWHYDVDEAIVLLDGSMLLNFGGDEWRTVLPGESVLFRKGTSVDWIVPSHVVKHFTIHHGKPLAVRLMRRIKGVFK